MDRPDPIDDLFPAHLARLAAAADRGLAAAGCRALVAAAGLPQLRFLDDQPDPFAVSPQFKSWAPLLDAPGSFVLYVPGRRPTLLFHQPEDYWHKPPSLPSERWLECFEVEVIREPTAARARIPAGAALIGPRFPGCDDWGFAAINPQAFLDSVHYARAVKSPYELACLRRASLRGARGHAAAAAAFRDGASEYEIHLQYLRATDHQEVDLPYPNIIAFNEGAAVLHYTQLERAAPAHRLSCLIDAGAQFRGYASDITRTHVSAPSPFSELVEELDAVQQELCAMVLPGASYPDIHLAAHRQIGALLAELGIVRCSAEAAVETGLTSVFFPHGIGHLLGLQVHDVGGHQASAEGGTQPPPSGHRYLRLTRRLEAGTVVTIEPGVYFIDLLLAGARSDGRGRDIDWDTVADLKPYGGVRIEDDVAAGATGAENLTRDAFAALGH